MTDARIMTETVEVIQLACGTIGMLASYVGDGLTDHDRWRLVATRVGTKPFTAIDLEVWQRGKWRRASKQRRDRALLLWASTMFDATNAANAPAMRDSEDTA